MPDRVDAWLGTVGSRLPDGGAGWRSASTPGALEALLARLPDPAAPDVDPARALQVIRDAASQHGDLRTALATARAAVAVRDGESAEGWFDRAALGALLERTGSVDEGVRHLDAAWKALQGARDVRVAVVAQNLGAALARLGRWNEALAPLRKAVDLRRAHAPDTAALALAQLGELLQKLGRLPDALPLLSEAHAVSVRVEGPSSPRTIARAHLAGIAHNAAEHYPEAARFLRPVYEATSPADTERRAAVAFELGVALDRSGADEESIRRIDESVRLTRALSQAAGHPHEALANRLAMMAQVHGRRGRAGEAEGLLLEALEAEGRLHGDASPEVAARTAQLGHFCYQAGRADEAVGWMETATSLVETALGVEHPQTTAVADAHVALLLELAQLRWTADPQGARTLAERAFEVGSRLLGHVHGRTRAARDLLARPSRR